MEQESDLFLINIADGEELIEDCAMENDETKPIVAKDTSVLMHDEPKDAKPSNPDFNKVGSECDCAEGATEKKKARFSDECDTLMDGDCSETSKVDLLDPPAIKGIAKHEADSELQSDEPSDALDSQSSQSSDNSRTILPEDLFERKLATERNKPNMNSNTRTQITYGCICMFCEKPFMARSPVVIKCGHILCLQCFQSSLRTDVDCPLCKIPVNPRRRHMYFMR